MINDSSNNGGATTSGTSPPLKVQAKTDFAARGNGSIPPSTPVMMKICDGELGGKPLVIPQSPVVTRGAAGRQGPASRVNNRQRVRGPCGNESGCHDEGEGQFSHLVSCVARKVLRTAKPPNDLVGREYDDRSFCIGIVDQPEALSNGQLAAEVIVPGGDFCLLPRSLTVENYFGFGNKSCKDEPMSGATDCRSDRPTSYEGTSNESQRSAVPSLPGN